MDDSWEHPHEWLVVLCYLPLVGNILLIYDMVNINGYYMVIDG